MTRFTRDPPENESNARPPFQKRAGHQELGRHPLGARVDRVDDAVDARRGDRPVGRQGRESGSVSQTYGQTARQSARWF